MRDLVFVRNQEVKLLFDIQNKKEENLLLYLMMEN